jgi:dTDP-4-dehydrorhamnose 3,5-epimerase-like enzyme
MKGIRIHELTKKKDSRGWLLKVVMNRDITGNKEFGEIYVTAAYPGNVKGEHYHEQTSEWFCVVKGKGQLLVMDKYGHEKEEILMGDDNMVTVEVKPNIIHAIKNIGEDMMYLLAYSDTAYDFSSPDTFPFKVTFS